MGDIIHLVEPKPERRHILAGVLLSLALHGMGIGKMVYDVWKQVDEWRNLLSIEIVDVPGAASARRPIDIIALSQPLYYPPGLVKPKPTPADREAKRRQQAARRAQEKQTEQAQQSGSPDPGSPAKGPDLQSQIQLIQQGVQRARTLNVAPIRDQIANIYKAQQEGKIALGNISVAVNFRVREDGAFTHVRLVESSGISEVDNAALVIVDELSQLRTLAPLQKTDSVTLRLSVGQEVELKTIVVAQSEALAAEQVNQLNGLLLAARLYSVAQKQTKVAEFLSTIEIKQDGTNILTSARIPRTEASRLLKKQFGAGS